MAISVELSWVCSLSSSIILSTVERAVLAACSRNWSGSSFLIGRFSSKLNYFFIKYFWITLKWYFRMAVIWHLLLQSWSKKEWSIDVFDMLIFHNFLPNFCIFIFTGCTHIAQEIKSFVKGWKIIQTLDMATRRCWLGRFWGAFYC